MPNLGAGVPGISATPASGAVQDMNPHHKTRQLQFLLVDILREFAAAYGPLVVILEDVHYFDTASWVLFWLASKELPRSVLFLATLRPGFAQPAASLRGQDRKAVLLRKVREAYNRLLREPTTLHLQLAPLSAAETREFVAQALAGIRVPDHVTAMLWEKSSGHPAFLEQFVVFLQYYSRVAAAALATGAPAESGPSTFQLVSHGMEFIRNTVGIHSIIQDRVDRLAPEYALLLKVASVGGLTIYVDLLQAAHPQSPSLESVLAGLDYLQSQRFVQQDEVDENLWRFCQVLARDVVFDMIPITQRRDWHGRLAAAMERLAPDLPLPPSTIAYHWLESCAGLEVAQWPRALKAMEYWERAGVAAVDAGTPAEALNLLQKAQDVAEVLDRYFATHTRSVWMIAGGDRGGGLPVVPRPRRIHWERCMAAMGWGAGITREGTTQCMVHCLRGLALARVALPWEEAYLSQVRWRRRLAMDWRPRSRLLRACLGYSPEPVHVAFERRVAMLDHDSLFLMRPLPLEPAAQEGGPCPGLMTRFLPSADSDPGEGSEGFCSDTFAPCPPKPELCSRDEVLYILEMLCTALLVSKPLDLEGVKYLMWVCRHLKGTQKKRGRCRRLQGILADAKTALSQAEAEERMSLRVAPLLGLSEHLAGAEAGKKA